MKLRRQEAGKFWEKEVNIVAADALAPYVTRSVFTQINVQSSLVGKNAIGIN